MPGANEVLGCPVNKSMATFFGMPLPYILDVQCHNLFLLFFSISKQLGLPTLCLNWVVGCPSDWMPGAFAPPRTHPLCTPFTHFAHTIHSLICLPSQHSLHLFTQSDDKKINKWTTHLLVHLLFLPLLSPFSRLFHQIVFPYRLSLNSLPIPIPNTT